MLQSKWLPVVFYTSVALLVLAPHIFPFSQISAETDAFGDSAYSLWSFWWTGRALLDGSNPFFTEYLFHPHGTTLAFHQYALTYSLLSLPFQYIIGGPQGLVIAFNSMVLLSFVLAGWGAYLLAWRLTASVPAAYLAGLLYTLAPYHLLNSPRLGVMAIELLPFYVLALLRLEERPDLRRAALLSLCLAISYYTSLEYALYLVLFSLLWFVHRGLSGRLRRSLVGYLVLSALLFSALAAPLLVQQLAIARQESNAIGGKLAVAERWSPALASFVTPSRKHPLYGDALRFAGSYSDDPTTGMRSETSFALTGWLLVLACLLLRSKGRGFWLFVALFFLSLSLGPTLRISGSWSTDIPMPYRALYEMLPPIQAVKEPARMLPIAFLALCVLAAKAVQSLGQRLEGRRRTYLVTMSLLGFLILFESLTAWPWDNGTPLKFDSIAAGTTPGYSLTPCCDPFYEELADQPGDFAVMVVNSHDAHAAIAQTLHGHRSAGWHGFIPRAAAMSRASPFYELHKDLIAPRRIFARSGAERTAREDRYRRALRAADVRFVVIPASSDGPAQALLRRLGGQIRREGRLLVAELAPQEALAADPELR